MVLFVLLGDLEDAEASLFLGAGVAALAARPLPPPAAVTKEGVKNGIHRVNTALLQVDRTWRQAETGKQIQQDAGCQAIGRVSDLTAFYEGFSS